MNLQNAAASSCCIAVNKPLPWKERSTSSRTDISVSKINKATVKIGRQLSQPRRRGMKYRLDNLQNCRPHRVRLMSSQAMSANPTTVKAKVRTSHIKLVNHSVDQSISTDILLRSRTRPDPGSDHRGLMVHAFGFIPKCPSFWWAISSGMSHCA